MNYTYQDPLNRIPDEPLDPTRHTFEVLLEKKNNNPRSFQAIWQQTPRGAQGNLIDPEWFNLVDIDYFADFKFLVKARAWDFAYSEKEVGKKNPDWTVGVLGGLFKRDDNYHIAILSLERWRKTWSKTKASFFKFAEADTTNVHIVVESGGAQKVAFEDIEGDKKIKPFRLKAVNPVADKVARAQPWMDFAETGRVWIVNSNWTQSCLDEFAGFPKSTHDDQVDAVTYLYHYFTQYMKSSKPRLVGYKGLYR
jgi:predicted phage terminase large subunit-like protein